MTRLRYRVGAALLLAAACSTPTPAPAPVPQRTAGGRGDGRIAEALKGKAGTAGEEG